MDQSDRDDGLPSWPAEPSRTADGESAYDLFRRGEALLAARHHAQAVIVLERASRIEPGRGSIIEALGRACFNSGQFERAAIVFAELLDLDPSAHYAHYGLGQSLKRTGRRREARVHLRVAVALSPSTALYRAALDRLGSRGSDPPSGADRA